MDITEFGSLGPLPNQLLQSKRQSTQHMNVLNVESHTQKEGSKGTHAKGTSSISGPSRKHQKVTDFFISAGRKDAILFSEKDRLIITLIITKDKESIKINGNLMISLSPL